METFYAGMAEIRDFGGVNEQIILQPHADFRLTDAGGAGEAVSYLHRDHLSSVRLITDAAGQVEQSTSYTPYGDPTTANLQTTTPEEHSFIGERFDASTGLLYLNARYYDPALGRFMQPDWWNPRRRGEGMNRYAYAGNDPVNFSDMNGRKVPGYVGHHMNTVNGNLELAANGANIRFMTREAHTALHVEAGGFQKVISRVRLLERTDNGRLPDLAGKVAKIGAIGYWMGAFALGAAAILLDNFPDPVRIAIDQSGFFLTPMERCMRNPFCENY